MTVSAKPRKNLNVGALSVIFLCLLVSALFRIGDREIAFANEEANGELMAEAEANTQTESQQCRQPEHVGQLLKAIRERQDFLDIQDLKITDRMQALAVAEKQLELNIAELVAAERKLAATLAIANEAAENDLKRLTSVYENMKPKNAAELFGEMAPEFAAGFLARMRADSAASIMGLYH